MIDLISDTITQPTKGMMLAMTSAPLGDDVFGEDPTVNQLQEMVADMFGMEAALFCPSGTMTNQIAIKVHTQPLDEVICDKDSHIYQYEAGAWAFHSGVSIKCLDGTYGKISNNQVEAAIQPKADWLPQSSLVVLENTCNRGGGAVYALEEVRPIREVCTRNNLRLHLDGARLFNALAVTGESTQAWGPCFDSISLCLSKGLGAPIGSLLIGSKSFIQQSRRIRKAFGGGMRQAGILAAAGIYAIMNHRDRLSEDHAHAKILGNTLASLTYVTDLRPVTTNILLFDVKTPWNADILRQKLLSQGIRVSGFGKHTIRMVTHLDCNKEQILKVCSVLESLEKEF